MTERELERLASRVSARLLRTLVAHGILPRRALEDRCEEKAGSNSVLLAKLKENPVPGHAVVYFLRCSAAGAIKIGYSTDPIGRISALQSASPTPLQVLGAVQARSFSERSLHRRFRHLRLNGEWFSPGSDLVEFIESNAREIRIGLRARRRSR